MPHDDVAQPFGGDGGGGPVLFPGGVDGGVDEFAGVAFRAIGATDQVEQGGLAGEAFEHRDDRGVAGVGEGFRLQAEQVRVFGIEGEGLRQGLPAFVAGGVVVGEVIARLGQGVPGDGILGSEFRGFASLHEQLFSVATLFGDVGRQQPWDGIGRFRLLEQVEFREHIVGGDAGRGRLVLDLQRHHEGDRAVLLGEAIAGQSAFDLFEQAEGGSQVPRAEGSFDFTDGGVAVGVEQPKLFGGERECGGQRNGVGFLPWSAEDEEPNQHDGGGEDAPQVATMGAGGSRSGRRLGHIANSGESRPVRRSGAVSEEEARGV